jgi:hypothetical protein
MYIYSFLFTSVLDFKTVKGINNDTVIHRALNPASPDLAIEVSLFFVKYELINWVSDIWIAIPGILRARDCN